MDHLRSSEGLQSPINRISFTSDTSHVTGGWSRASTCSGTLTDSDFLETCTTKVENEDGEADTGGKSPTRVAALIATASRLNSRLSHTAKDHIQISKVLMILNTPATRQAIDQKTLDKALISACAYGHNKITVTALLENGANVNRYQHPRQYESLQISTAILTHLAGY